MSHVSHAFLCVDVLVDETKVGGNGTFMGSQTQTACKDVLATFIEKHANVYHPLRDGTDVSLIGVKICHTDQGKSTTDVGTFQYYSAFLGFPMYMALSEVPTKRFTFKGIRPNKEEHPRQDIVFL